MLELELKQGRYPWWRQCFVFLKFFFFPLNHWLYRKVCIKSEWLEVSGSVVWAWKVEITALLKGEDQVKVLGVFEGLTTSRERWMGKLENVGVTFCVDCEILCYSCI